MKHQIDSIARRASYRNARAQVLLSCLGGGSPSPHALASRRHRMEVKDAE